MKIQSLLWIIETGLMFMNSKRNPGSRPSTFDDCEFHFWTEIFTLRRIQKSYIQLPYSFRTAVCSSYRLQLNTTAKNVGKSVNILIEVANICIKFQHEKRSTKNAETIAAYVTSRNSFQNVENKSKISLECTLKGTAA